jgi:RNA polymerase sigma-70 factor (ECF subfamily)
MSRRSERVPHHVPTPSTSQALFEQHVLPELELMLRVARSLTRNDADAEDLVQDTLIRAFRAIDRFDGLHARAWLLTILRNTHINRNRRQRPELLRDPDGASRHFTEVASAELTDASVDQGFDAEIERALAELDEPFRRVIQLVDVEGLSYAEAAEALGVPAGTVMSRLHRARGRIRDRLDRAGMAPRSHS